MVAVVTANRAEVRLLARALAPRSRATSTKTSCWLNSSAICTAGDEVGNIPRSRIFCIISITNIHHIAPLALRVRQTAREKSFEIKFPAQNAETRWRARAALVVAPVDAHRAAH